MRHWGLLLGENHLLVAAGTPCGADIIFARGTGLGRPPTLTAQSLRGKLGRLVVVLLLREHPIPLSANDKQNHEDKKSGCTFRHCFASDHRKSLPRFPPSVYV